MRGLGDRAGSRRGAAGCEGGPCRGGAWPAGEEGAWGLPERGSLLPCTFPAAGRPAEEEGRNPWRCRSMPDSHPAPCTALPRGEGPSLGPGLWSPPGRGRWATVPLRLPSPDRRTLRAAAVLQSSAQRAVCWLLLIISVVVMNRCCW